MPKTLKLLIVTESVSIKKAVELALVEKQFEVKSIEPKLIISTLEEWNPDIVITDIKDNSLPRKTLTILLYSPWEEKELASFKVDATLKKPFNRTTLLKTINSVIAKHGSSALAQDDKRDTQDDTVEVQALTPELEKIARQVIEKIGWEVIPRLSESLLKEEINKLLKLSSQK